MNARPIRLGFVGGGGNSYIGKVHRGAAMIGGRFAIVAGCFSSDGERSRQSARDIGIAAERTYVDFSDMARVEAGRSDGIEAVVILTPNGLHYPVAKAFLDRNIHIICEKPLTTRLDHARELASILKGRDRIFAVAHAYPGYSSVQSARKRIQSGELGAVRIVQIEYAQSWLSTPIENEGHKLAQQRTDPDVNGAAGCVSALGSHASNLLRFVTGLEVSELSANLVAMVPGRSVPDNAHITMRLTRGAHGMMWISQTAPGHNNSLRIRVYGERGSLFWEQENPDQLLLTMLGAPTQLISRGGPGMNSVPPDLPAGHPEGFIGAFSHFYEAFADQIIARSQRQAVPDSTMWLPTLTDGIKTVEFADAALRSSQNNGAWVRPSAD